MLFFLEETFQQKLSTGYLLQLHKIKNCECQDQSKDGDLVNSLQNMDTVVVYLFQDFADIVQKN